MENLFDDMPPPGTTLDDVMKEIAALDDQLSRIDHDLKYKAVNADGLKCERYNAQQRRAELKRWIDEGKV